MYVERNEGEGLGFAWGALAAQAVKMGTGVMKKRKARAKARGAASAERRASKAPPAQAGFGGVSPMLLIGGAVAAVFILPRILGRR